jgi:hypothetical protein
VRVGDGVGPGPALRLPLLRAGRALGELPLVGEERLEEAVVPGDRGRRPGALQPAGDRVLALALAEGVLPAQAHRLDGAALGLRPHQRRVARAVGLSERVATGDEGDGLLVVHRHAGEGVADVARRRQRIRPAVRPFRVDVDEPHLHGAERPAELAVAAVALVAEPRVLRPPEDLLGLPHVLAPEAEAERLEAHRLQRAVAGEHQQVGPRDLPAVLLLDRPEQPAGLVEVGVVRPAVQRGEALRAVTAASAPVGDAVGAGRVPAHADEQGAVVPVVGRPPVLRRGHHLEQVPLQRLDVERGELPRVVEVLAHGVGPGRVLVQDLQVELVRPPVLVRPGPGVLDGRCRDCRVLALAGALRRGLVVHPEAVTHVGRSPLQ